MKRLIIAVSMMCAFTSAATLLAAEGSKFAEAKAEYVKKVHAELDDLSGRIDALERKGKEAGASAHEDVRQKLKELKAGRKAAKKDLSKLKRASGKAWADLKAGLDKSLEDLKKGLVETKKD